MRLAAVFDQRDPLAVRERREGCHICRLTVQVHRQEGRCSAGDGLLGSRRVQREPLGIDIGKHRMSARHHNRNCRVGGRQRSRHDFIARSDAQGPKNQRERVGAVTDANGMSRARCRSELLLECLDLGTQHEPCAIDHATDRLVDGGRLLSEVKIGERNSRGVHARVGAWSSRYSPACAR